MNAKQAPIKVKLRANRLAQAAFKRGRIAQTACEDCGGESHHMHHEDYTQPLRVTWLCRSCHRRRHPGPPVLRRRGDSPEDVKRRLLTTSREGAT